MKFKAVAGHGGALLGLVLAGAVLGSARLGEYSLNLIFVLCLYVILSQSWNILGGYCGQVNLGLAAFFGTGAFVCRYLWTSGHSIYLALGGGGVAALVLACIIGGAALRLRAHYFAIGTLGLAMIALITVQSTFPGVDFLPPDLLSGYSAIPRCLIALTVAFLTTELVYFLAHSKLGLAMRCVREDEEAALAVGINVVRCKIIAAGMSTFLAGLAGGLFAFYNVSFYYYAPFELGWSFDPVLIVFIGGAGTVFGPVVGALCYVLLKELFALSLGQVNVLIFGIAFIGIVLFLPEGLMSLAQRLHPRSRASKRRAVLERSPGG
ncbi:MAG: branched-chain amino acid ABC transporter permease [Deltaproteobacteria bacterium]|nr:branched-chain amino acid ABC transporter permease [Deltaproteobacteria bacterium]